MKSTEPNPPPVLADYELLRRVGQGSYGEVWLARSVVGGFRAVKIVHREAFKDPRPFEREFEGITRYEPVSRHHPGLVDILHVGRGEGYFYYVMELADDCRAGERIDPDRYEPSTLAWMRDRASRIPLGRCLRIGMALAAALDHLHCGGLAHRDIKPSNIIFVAGEPKFADIGLVTRLGEPATFVGTAGYLAPEGPGQAGADVFSLGKVMYEIAMGRSGERFPELPADLRDWPDAAHLLAFNEIILKACQPDPARRLASARALGEAFENLFEQITDKGGATRLDSRSDRGVTVRRGRVVLLGGDLELEPEGIERVERWRRLLESRGVEVDVDLEKTPGVAWARALEKRIRAAQAVLALVSDSGERTPLMAYGLGIARDAAKTGSGKPGILAVRMKGAPTWPRNIALALEGATVLDWNGPEDDERLGEAVAKRLGA